ncbi:MAG TPA: NB-ARC domain-containing protein [Candidatus Eremiobacteraceae bacterium]
MSKAGPASGRRIRAYVFACVTTAIVLVFAIAEWGAERFISDRSRAASTVIEIIIVLVATLVFRPVHQRVEAAVEAAFYKRKRQALDSLAKFRRELTSFSDVGQLLRRVIEAIDHFLDTQACAVYLRRSVFRAEASSFDAAAEDVGFDDPLAVRLRSTGAPAKVALLKSSARGTHAFPMTAAGDLVGFLLVRDEQSDDDEEETQMLSGLAQDLAVALVVLDPSLRARKQDVPNNIPADLLPLIGRERELAEIKAVLSQSRLVTLTGAGGVGKTRIALQCAADSIAGHEHGAWFINLAPITDGTLIAATTLAALNAGSAEGGDDATRLVEHLRARDALIVIDNCEQIVGDAAALIARVRAHCPRIAILSTSRELLHLDGEQVYRLASLRLEAAVELFTQRASAVSTGFDAEQSLNALHNICERLDCMPLAIELAAARVRALSVEEISARLHERFQLLTSSDRTALPRRQTLTAMIEWSYDLLSPDEQSLFRHLGVFRGTFSLAAVTAMFARDGKSDEYHVLDLLTSLADKSLLTVKLALETRYGLLETIREFASQKAVDEKETLTAASRHADHFAAVAGQAYREFDSRVPPGWLDRLAPDIDNFREALGWTLEGPGERRVGAQLAADCGVIFLRLGLLGEGLRWCERALNAADDSPATAGRIEYVASMMHNNSLEPGRALEAAQRAVASYRQSADERGLIRALSQTAYQFARASQFDEAQAPAAEAIQRARDSGDPNLIVAVLRRCASSLPPEAIAQARDLFEEALTTARTMQRSDEVCHVLQWWASSEGAAGCYDRAMDLLQKALDSADVDVQKYIESDLACCALASGSVEKAEPHARRALTLAVDSRHPVLAALAFAYCAPVHAQVDPQQGARLFGFARARLLEMQFDGDRIEKIALQNALQSIERVLGNADASTLFEEGAALDQDEALALLATQSAVGVVLSPRHAAGDDGVVTLLS